MSARKVKVNPYGQGGQLKLIRPYGNQAGLNPLDEIFLWVDLFLIATPRHSSKWLNWSSYAKKAV